MILTIFQAQQKGQIGIVVVGEFMEPLTDTPDDKAAAERYMDFLFGWSVLIISFSFLFVIIIFNGINMLK